jgi:hypothetical protein
MLPANARINAMIGVLLAIWGVAVLADYLELGMA